MEDFSKFAITFSGIAALQIPTLISCAPKGSNLALFQRFGFPLNMSKAYLRCHFSFSPGNMIAGRYYTLVTSLFNHEDQNHLFTNLLMLATTGKTVHTEVGRFHFLSTFIGGGIAGNLAMWLQYVIQKRRFQKGIIDANTWPIFNTAIGNSLIRGKEELLSSSFDQVNSLISCLGCSASVSAITSLEACITLETIVTRLRQAIERNMNRQYGDPVEVDLNLLYDLTHLVLAGSILWTDLQALVGNSDSGTGFFSGIFAYSMPARIGHAGHLGGFLFGILYYFFCKR